MNDFPALRADGPPSRRRVRSCTLFVLGCVAVAEIVVGRTDLPWRLVPQSDLGTVFLLEESIIRKSPEPQLVVFGGSRARGAFLPTVMEQQMGLRRGQVLSLAMGGTNVLDAVITYERSRAVLSRARILIFQIDPFQFSVGMSPTPRYRHWASWSDRMAYSGADRLRLIGDLIFRMDNALPVLTVYAKEKMLRNRQTLDRPGIDEFGRLAVAKIADDHEAQYFQEEAFRFWIDEFYRNYEYSSVLEGRLARLIKTAQANGSKVYLVCLPTAGNYYELLRRLKGDPHGQFKKRMTELARNLGIRCQFWDSPAEAGLNDRDFRDWGHLNTPGAVKWTKFFAEWMEAEERRIDASRSTPRREGGT